MRILLTGFEPFGDFAINPSQAIVERLAATQRPDQGYDLCTAILPVVYAEAGERLVALIDGARPDAVVMLGVGGAKPALRLERVALNLNDAAKPDNSGDVADGRVIVPDGPVGYWSTLPLGRLRALLAKQNTPAIMSNDAGAFLCNHVFYVARHHLETTGRAIPCGFIHVPRLAEQAQDDEERARSLPLEVMVWGIALCLRELAGMRE